MVDVHFLKEGRRSEKSVCFVHFGKWLTIMDGLLKTCDNVHISTHITNLEMTKKNSNDEAIFQFSANSEF